MTIQIALVLSVLILAVILFITERLRVDVTALLVLGGLALMGLITPGEALSGFSNPAVVTVWAVFILSGGLSRTGVASWVGTQMLRLAGRGEAQLIALIMLVAASLSAFMNNVGVAALLLPVVMDIARHTRRPPSRLLIPLAYGSLLGGLTTLIGTPPNILISDALSHAGLKSFSFFSFTPVGGIVMLAGVAYMILIGRHLLPQRDIAREFSSAGDEQNHLFDLKEELLIIRVPTDSLLAGKTLLQSRLGSALGLNVIAIMKDDNISRSPTAGTVIQGGDRLLVEGSLDRWNDLSAWQQLVAEQNELVLNRFLPEDGKTAELVLDFKSPLVGQSLFQTHFRSRFGVHILAVRRNTQLIRTDLALLQFQPGDSLLVMGTFDKLEALYDSLGLQSIDYFAGDELMVKYGLHGWLMTLKLPEESLLVGKTLEASRLGDALDMTVLGIVRHGVVDLVTSSDSGLQAGDTLLVQGRPESLNILKGLQNLEIEREIPDTMPSLESNRVGVMEVVLSPHTTLSGKTLRQIRFREKNGLTVLGIWRGGKAMRTNLRDIPLRFGDALLLYGPRRNLGYLGNEPDFLVLTETVQAPPRKEKAKLGILIMTGVLGSVVLGWLPISIAALVGATLMVVTGCLMMEEAYRFIEWRAIFLIAGMLPLGIAMENTGAAIYLSEMAISVISGWGGTAVIAGLFIITILVSQVMPNAAVAVLLAPIALNASDKLGISPYALMMVVALASAACFLSPVTHPANLLVLGPGGYRFSDYIKVGLPLTLVTLIVMLIVLPVFWPL